MKCYVWDNTIIDDEDLRQPSMSCPNLQEIRLRLVRVSNTLPPFITWRSSNCLPYWSIKPFLLKLLDSCPKLKQITVSDWNTLGRRWYLEEVASENLFAAAAKLPSSFEPKISKGENCTQDGLIAYGQATRGYSSFLAVGKAIWRVAGTDCHSTEIIPYFYLD